MKDNNELAIQIDKQEFQLIQEFNDDPEKRLRLYDLIFRCSFLGEELNEEDMGVKMAAKAILGGIEKRRNNYTEKCKKNAEYGIQGKEFGKLGGRPRKGETKDEYNERKRLENESLVSEEMGEDSKWTKMLNEIKENKNLIAQIKNQTIPDEIFYDFIERYGEKTVLSVIRWIFEKNNV